MRSVLLVLGLILLVSCQLVSGPKVAWTPEWAAEGARLEAVKATTGPDDSADQVHAYRSNAVDITGNGVYTFRFGPLRPTFTWGPRAGPVGISVNWPHDKKFHLNDRGFRIVVVNGERYLQADFVVTEFEEAYPRFYGWLY